MKKNVAFALVLALLSLAATPQKTPPTVARTAPAPAAAVLQSAPTQMNWYAPPASPAARSDSYLSSLKGQRLTAQVVGDGSVSVIVIYGPNGKCLLCLGSPKACTVACPRSAAVD